MTKSEKLCKERLIAEGYKVEKQNYSQWGSKDLFNLWDFIAVSSKNIRFIQVSSVYLCDGSHAKKDYKGFPVPPNCTKEFWRFDRKTKDFVITIL